MKLKLQQSERETQLNENRSNWKFAGSWPKLVPLNTSHSRSHAVKQCVVDTPIMVASVNGGGTVLKNHSVNQSVTVLC